MLNNRQLAVKPAFLSHCWQQSWNEEIEDKQVGVITVMLAFLQNGAFAKVFLDIQHLLSGRVLMLER